MPAPLSEALADAAQAVAAVLAGRALTEALAQLPAARRPAAQSLAFYSLRHLGHAQTLRDQLVARRPAKPQVDALLLVALALLDAAQAHLSGADTLPADQGAAHPSTRHRAPHYAPHTLVNQAVAACAPWPALKGLVNGVLRRFLRERNALHAASPHTPLARWNHPDWWVARLRAAYPRDWQRLLTIANQHAPLALRVNRRRANRAQVLAAFADAGILARPVPDRDDALVLESPRPVPQLPGFADGWWSVQDPGAGLAARLLPLAEGMRVLDACAAPGGKTAHILELAKVDLLALDVDAARLARVHENLQRLGLTDPRQAGPRVQVRAGDAAQPAHWWDGQPFDAVLLDAPCTASGIVRRHPDIRWLRRPEDIARAAHLQARLLEALWPLVAPGGVLLYATCSIFAEENAAQAEAFARRHPDVEPDVGLDINPDINPDVSPAALNASPDAAPGAHAGASPLARAELPPAPGQLLPVGDEAPIERQHDGFYYARLRKQVK